MRDTMIELNLAQPVENLKAIECPQRGGINFPCAICQECEIGQVTLTAGDGYMIENTVNSILIHLELQVQDDPVEQAALKILKQRLSEKIPAIQRGSWELGDFQIMLTNDMVHDKQLVENVKRFMKEFPGQARQLMIGAKRAITRWSDNEVKQLAHRYFREI